MLLLLLTVLPPPGTVVRGASTTSPTAAVGVSTPAPTAAPTWTVTTPSPTWTVAPSPTAQSAFARWTDADGHQPAGYYAKVGHNSAYDYCLAQAAIRPEVIGFSYLEGETTGNCWLHLGVDNPTTPESDKPKVGGLSFNEKNVFVGPDYEWTPAAAYEGNTQGIQGTFGELSAWRCYQRQRAPPSVSFYERDNGYCTSHGQSPVYYSKKGVSERQCDAEARARSGHGVAAYTYEIFTNSDLSGTCSLHVLYESVALPYPTSSWTKCEDIRDHHCGDGKCVEGKIDGTCAKTSTGPHNGNYYSCHKKCSGAIGRAGAALPLALRLAALAIAAAAWGT